MRNLKKALAMVLALMMALSLMSFASASDYADGGKIEKNEAVEVMSMINVFQGTDGGNFDPEGNLTRAQAAKIISYMKLGSAVADALPKDEAPFNDVKADRWYTGYVTYAKSEGIIAGRSETTFDPNGNVTGYEFGKMVLEAAGIKGEYTGTSSWMLNINLALRGNNPGKVNLMEGVNAVLSSPISRENACQLAFNGLNYTATGETTGNFVIVGDGLSLNGTVCSSRSEAAMLIAILDEANAGSYTIEAEKNNRGSLADVVFSLEKTRGTSTFGAPANVWTSGDKSVTVADAAAKSYESTTGKAIKADLKMTGAVTATVVTDGKVAVASTLNDADAFGGNGSKVDVYKTGDDTVKIVVVNTYVAVIASHTDAKDEAKEKITLTLDGANKPGATTNGTTFETTNFTADDKGAVVLYTAKVAQDGATSTIQSVTVPAEVKGTVTRYNTTANTFVVDGKTYKTSLMKHSTKGVSASNVGEEITLYLDNNGHVIYATGDAAPDAVYAVVVDWAKGGQWASDTAYSVKLLLTDGSIVQKTLGTLKGADDSTITISGDGDVSGLVGTIVKYAEDGNNANLTKTTDANTVAKFTEVVRNQPTLKSGLVANSKTIFLVGSKDGKTLNVYNGISSVPSTQKLADGGSPEFVAVAEDGVAKVVYIAKSEPKAGTTDVTDVIYVVGPGSETKDMDKGSYKVFAAVVNGEITTIETTTDVTGMPADGEAKLLKSVAKNDKDLITAGTAMDGTNFIAAATSNTAPANSVIKVGANSYVYDDNTKVYVIEDGEISLVAMSAVEKNDDGVSVTGYTKGGVIVELFILKGAEAPQGHVHNYQWVKATADDVAAAGAAPGFVADNHVEKCSVAGCNAVYRTTNKHTAAEKAPAEATDLGCSVESHTKHNHDYQWVVAESADNTANSGISVGEHVKKCATDDGTVCGAKYDTTDKHAAGSPTTDKGCNLGTCTPGT